MKNSLAALTLTLLLFAPVAVTGQEPNEPVLAPQQSSEENMEAAAASEQAEAEVTASGASGEALEQKMEVEQSYSDPELDKKVSTALFRQGYFAGESEDSKESFVKALKNFQTLNGMSPTGEITPEVVQKLGVGEDQFSPE